MRIEKYVRNPVEYQNHIDEEALSALLSGATHVETYTKDEGRFGGDHTLVIFAFYPDEGKG